VTAAKAEDLFRFLDGAVARAVRAGYYPARCVPLREDGGCCAVGALEALGDPRPFASVDARFGAGVAVSAAWGFDGEENLIIDDPEAYAVGRRLAGIWL
jgi:hypothetical protein